jgi:S-adenosylmethionine synthetase
MRSWSFTSESVTEGHPDKVCDAVADAILDAVLARDPRGHVAVEAVVKTDTLILVGEISAAGQRSMDFEAEAREAIRSVGYDDPEQPFAASTLRLLSFLSAQGGEIAEAVTGMKPAAEQGAGDQGMMFGYASAETPELMPAPILLAHRLARALAEARRSAEVGWLRPDGKTQVTVEYDADGRPQRVSDIVVSCHHAPEVSQPEIREFVGSTLVPRALVGHDHGGARLLVNPAGRFSEGGPAVDSGLSGRKNIVDTYGGFARHGGGALSGKDPSKVDRSAAYFARWVARQVVREELAQRAEVRVAYAIGVAEPLDVDVDTFGTGDADRARAFLKRFDFRPAAMIERLDLLRPIYRRTTNYGHFGKPDLPWEQDPAA